MYQCEYIGQYFYKNKCYDSCYYYGGPLLPSIPPPSYNLTPQHHRHFWFINIDFRYPAPIVSLSISLGPTDPPSKPVQREATTISSNPPPFLPGPLAFTDAPPPPFDRKYLFPLALDLYDIYNGIDDIPYKPSPNPTKNPTTTPSKLPSDTKFNDRQTKLPSNSISYDREYERAEKQDIFDYFLFLPPPSNLKYVDILFDPAPLMYRSKAEEYCFSLMPLYPSKLPTADCLFPNIRHQ